MTAGHPAAAAPRTLAFHQRIGGQDCRICWHDWPGPAGRRPVLCLPALNRNGQDFAALAAVLAGDRRVLCLDLPGRGDSDWLHDPADYHHQTYLAVIAGLLTAAGLDGTTIDVVGTSLGGILGLYLAADRPGTIGRLVLNDVGTFTARSVFHQAAQSIARPVRFRSIDQAVLTFKVMTASCGPLTDAQWRAVTAPMLTPTADGGFTLRYDPAIAQRLFQDAATDLDLMPVYRRVTAPVLLIRGEQSTVVSAETAAAMAETGPRARCLTVPGTGHFPMLVKPAEIAAVQDFLD